jgi:hypothetical protein
MKRLLLLTTLALKASTATANAEDIVQQLYSMCRLPTSDPHSAYCAGLIAGIGVLMWSLEPTHRFAMCADGSLSPSPEAMRQAFLNWAEKHPQDWKMHQTRGVLLALQDAWPCPASTGNGRGVQALPP